MREWEGRGRGWDVRGLWLSHLYAWVIGDLGVAQDKVLLLPLCLEARMLLVHVTLLHRYVTACSIGLGTLAQIVRRFLARWKEEGRVGMGKREEHGHRIQILHVNFVKRFHTYIVHVHHQKCQHMYQRYTCQCSKYRVHTCTSAGTFPKVQVHFVLYLHCVQVACPTIK